MFAFTYLYGFYSKPGFSFHAGGADDGGICPSDRFLDKTSALKLLKPNTRSAVIGYFVMNFNPNDGTVLDTYPNSTGLCLTLPLNRIFPPMFLLGCPKCEEFTNSFVLAFNRRGDFTVSISRSHNCLS